MRKRLLTLLLAAVLVLTMGAMLVSCGKEEPGISTKSGVDDSEPADTTSTSDEKESSSEVTSTKEEEVVPFAYPRIACIGDSLTESSPAYPDNLIEILGKSATIGNFGLSGASLTTYTNNDSYGCYKEYAKEKYEASLKFDADLVIIMLGTNDATKIVDGSPKYDWKEVAPVYKADYLALIDEYKATYPDAVIVLMTSPEALENNRLKISNDILENNIYPLQLEIAKEAGVKLIDLRAYFKGQSDKAALYRDKIHFSEHGAKVAAEYVISEINKF